VDKYTVTVEVAVEARYREVAQKRVDRLLGSRDKQWAKDCNMEVEVGELEKVENCKC
jgi:hypothetical protein